jgi:hypothetical protein
LCVLSSPLTFLWKCHSFTALSSYQALLTGSDLNWDVSVKAQNVEASGSAPKNCKTGLVHLAHRLQTQHVGSEEKGNMYSLCV